MERTQMLGLPIYAPEDIFDLTKELFLDKKEDAKDNLLFIENSFDCLQGIDIKGCFERFLTNEQHVEMKSHIDESVNVFEHCCNSFGDYKNSRVRSFSIGRMLLLYSFILYWKNMSSINELEFAKRLRIINNMIKASEFELREDRMFSLLEQTEEIIVNGCIKIIENRNSFNSMQMQEELEKSKWIAENSEKYEQLCILEDHPLLNGGISVVGLKYLHYTNRFYSLFKCNRGLVNRALLSIGDYSLKIGWRYQIGSARVDATWKTLFHTNKDNVKKIHDFLITLLSKTEEFTDENLLEIINEYIKTAEEYDWKYYLVKYNYMSPEKYGMYYWPNNRNREKESYDILMMMTEKSIGGKNFNVFLYTLYIMFKDKFRDKPIRLGEYAYQEDGDKIELTYIGKYAYFNDNSFILEDMLDSSNKQIFPINQLNMIDKKDRIEIAWNVICEQMSSINS